MQRHAAQADRDRQQTRIHQQQEAEQQRRVGAVRGNSGEIRDEQQREARAQDRRVLERVVFRRPAANGSAAPEHQRRDRHNRKDGKDAQGCGQLAGGEKAVHPSPLIHRRQDQREHGQHRPGLLVGHPRQANVQEHQVGEQRNRPVLSGRQQRRRREAAEQPEHCDDDAGERTHAHAMQRAWLGDTSRLASSMPEASNSSTRRRAS